MAAKESSAEIADATRRTRLASERAYHAWWRSALAAFAVSLGVGKVVPELTSNERALGYELVGVAYVLLGVAFVAYGFVRQHMLERALAEGRYIPFGNLAALSFTIAGIALGAATLVIIVI
jgi:uncharacterized membrane protein YidH (DUF202 family)